MLKHVKYRALTQEDTKLLTQNTITIGVASKQWGAQADFGWCTTYQGDANANPLGSRASTVMNRSSFNNRKRAEPHAIQAALLFLQMHLKHIWNHQMQFRVITQHEAPLDALCHLHKTDNHNPQWRLNRNWEILQSINHNNNIHNMKCQLAQDYNPIHQFAINTAHTCILEYQAAHTTEVAKQRPTLDCGLAYL
jgi:hypothetical protein